MYPKNNYYKRKPAYFRELQRRWSNTNLVFIAVDWVSVDIIQRLNGVCLFCEKDEAYDFSFCTNREVWVLYTHPNDFQQALQLGHTVRSNGANKVFVIHINATLVREEKYV
jgi:hypothetical protein